MVSDKELLAYRDRLMSAAGLSFTTEHPVTSRRWAETSPHSGSADFQVFYQLSIGTKNLSVFLRTGLNHEGKDCITTTFGGSPFRSSRKGPSAVVSPRNAKGEFPAFGAIRRFQNELNAKERERLVFNEQNRDSVNRKKRLDAVFASVNGNGKWKISHSYQHQAESGRFSLHLNERTLNAKREEYSYNLSLVCDGLSSKEAIRMVEFLASLEPVKEGQP